MSRIISRQGSWLGASENRRVVLGTDDSDQRIGDLTHDAQEVSGSTLLPMLIGGLFLIVIGAILVMTFV